VWFARVEWRTLERFLQIFKKGLTLNLGGWFPFPGGKMIGAALIVNLFAAHLARFKIAASGRRLVVGMLTLALGALATAAVINSGMNDTVENGISSSFADLLWQLLRGGLVIISLAGAYGLALSYRRIR